MMFSEQNMPWLWMAMASYGILAFHRVISCARTAHCGQEVIDFAQLQTNLVERRKERIRSHGRNGMKTPWKTPAEIWVWT